MSISIGGVVFDSGTGTPTLPVAIGELSSWAAAAKAYRYGGSPPTGEGEVEAWADLNEADAITKLRDAGGLIGALVTVTFAHGSVVGVAVKSVNGAWQTRKGTVNGGVLVVRFVFDRSADKNDGEITRTVVKVQTAPTLAGAWTDEPDWACFNSSDGLGTYAGEAEASVVNVGPDPAKLGLWCRLVLTEAAAGFGAIGTVVWTGVITGASASARRDKAQGIGWGGRTVYRFAGLAHVLAQWFPIRWLEERDGTSGDMLPVPASPGGVADVGGALTFNDQGVGDRGAAFFQVDGPAGPQSPTVNVHKRGQRLDPSKWTASEALLSFIAQCRGADVARVPITVDAAGVGLAYSETWNVNRLSLLNGIAEILNPRQRRTFRLSADHAAAPPCLVVTVVDLDAAGTPLDLTGPDVADWHADLAAEATVDHWFLSAGSRAFVQTIDFGVQCAQWWTAAQRTAWDAANAATRSSALLEAVLHRWILIPTWTGDGYTGGSPIPYFRTIGAGNEETGELAVAGNYPYAPTAWGIDRTLPMGAGTDWITPGAYPVGNVVPQKTVVSGPLLYWRKAATPLEVLHFDFQVAVDANVAAVSIGRGADDATAIKTKIETDLYTIWGTFSFRHPLDWRVSAIEAPPRTDSPRVGFTYLPTSMFDRVDAMATAIVGVDGAGAAQFAAPGRRDNGGLLTDVRQRNRAHYTVPNRTIEWTQRTLALSAPVPGFAISTATVSVDNGPPIVNAVLTIGAPVTRRVVCWDRFTPSVRWTANPIVADLVGAGNRGAVVVAAQGAAALVKYTGDGAQIKNG